MYDRCFMQKRDMSLHNKIERLNEHSLAVLKRIKSKPFGKFDFHSDDILMRLPEGMKPNDTIETHKSKCQIKMTEKHLFPTYAAAENFIKVRFGDYKLEEETKNHKLYNCPHGPEDDKCTGFLKLYLGLEQPMILCSFGHYGHDSSVGQARFTGIEFSIVRLYTNIYWKRQFDDDANVRNIWFFFKHIFDDDHILNHVNAYDLRAVAFEVGKEKLDEIELKEGVFHDRRSSTLAANFNGVKEMHEKLRDIENPLREAVMQSKRIVKNDPANSSADANPPQENNGKTARFKTEPREYECPFLAPTRQAIPLTTEAMLTDIEWCDARADYVLGLKMWQHLIWFAKEVRNIVYLKMVAAGDDYDEECETNRQLFLKINQAVIIAEIMIERITKMYLMIEKAPKSEYVTDYNVNLNNPALRNINHPVIRPYFAVQSRAEKSAGHIIRSLRAKSEKALGEDFDFDYPRVRPCQMPYIIHRILIRELDEIKEEKLTESQKNHYRHAGATLPTLRNRESRTMMNHYENMDSIWSTTLPLFTSCSNLRFMWATGINLREKLIEFRAMELKEWKKHHKEKIRRLNWLFGRIERARTDSLGKLQEIRRAKAEEDALKKKLRNKNRKELKAKNAAEAKQQEKDEKRRNTPLRHYDGK
ncbi:hypothetical protein CAEBREN_13361 [Caenorhabditis brenneri]|uniref:Uncharacterized protein n=1 Tax=Caenorhabditis brenneri TaxID=135651 RepID=G0M736_CAEBE|nr:hypothetical protein CAEBREN_13361 [Caenorhabditis brenneri]